MPLDVMSPAPFILPSRVQPAANQHTTHVVAQTGIRNTTLRDQTGARLAYRKQKPGTYFNPKGKGSSMETLTEVASRMTYTDLLRRLTKAYEHHSADQNPNAYGDPHLETKLSAKLGSYAEWAFIALMHNICSDISYHQQAKQDLTEYAIRLRTTWLEMDAVESQPLDAA